MLPLPPEPPTGLRPVLLSALRVRLLFERRAPREEVFRVIFFSFLGPIRQEGVIVTISPNLSFNMESKKVKKKLYSRESVHLFLNGPLHRRALT